MCVWCSNKIPQWQCSETMLWDFCAVIGAIVVALTAFTSLQLLRLLYNSEGATKAREAPWGFQKLHLFVQAAKNFMGPLLRLVLVLASSNLFGGPRKARTGSGSGSGSASSKPSAAVARQVAGELASLAARATPAAASPTALVPCPTPVTDKKRTIRKRDHAQVS